VDRDGAIVAGRDASTVKTPIKAFVAERLEARNRVSRCFFDREADLVAVIARDFARRFGRGGRLVTFGRGASATDAQHVAVDFGRRRPSGAPALPAIDISTCFLDWAPALVGENDIALGFPLPFGDPAIALALSRAKERGALTVALPGSDTQADLVVPVPSPHSHIAQEIIEVLYHAIRETLPSCLEPEASENGDRSAAAAARAAAGRADTVAAIRAHAVEGERLREQVAGHLGEAIAEAVSATASRINAGATVFLFGVGGAASDANDWAIDCISGPRHQAVRAFSLSMDAATLTAISHDSGRDGLFATQLATLARPGDIAIGLSATGDCASVAVGLEEARARNILAVGILGGNGGTTLRTGAADVAIVVPSSDPSHVEEVQASIYHVMTECWRGPRGK
jgi:D-sedoheptulose 7-phosphate isomerase